jgi:hypothetical protein
MPIPLRLRMLRRLMQFEALTQPVVHINLLMDLTDVVRLVPATSKSLAVNS